MTGWDLFAVAAILILGVPHGGLDGAIARRTGWPAGTVSWLGFHLGYIGLAALVTGLWWLFPLPSLALFLLISGLHFGASDIGYPGSPMAVWSALLYPACKLIWLNLFLQSWQALTMLCY